LQATKSPDVTLVVSRFPALAVPPEAALVLGLVLVPV
jgi:hypothetical protein